MSIKILLAAMLLVVGGSRASVALAQSTQATSPGQSGSSNTLPQAPSGGRAATGTASGPETDQEKQADTQARKASGTVCRGC